LDRPLTDRRQFVSNKGRMAQVKHHANGVTTTLKGRITDVSETGFILTDDKGIAHDIAFAEGRDVKIIPVFK
jgi:ribosome maturation factor RimP